MKSYVNNAGILKILMSYHYPSELFQFIGALIITKSQAINKTNKDNCKLFVKLRHIESDGIKITLMSFSLF